jgi:tricorn protease
LNLRSKTSHLTDFKSSIKHPVVSADGRYVVFEKDFQIFKYEVRSGKTSKVPVVTFTNATAEKEKDFTVQNNISYFDVSADGKKLAFISRGELFVSDIKGKFIQKLKTNPLARVTEVKWKSDNKSLVFAQTNAQGVHQPVFHTR